MVRHIRKILVFAILAFMLALGGCIGHPSLMDASKLTKYERMENSTVVLPGCSGAVLKNDGNNSIILTALHCVQDFQGDLKDGRKVHSPVLVSTMLQNNKKICQGNVIATTEDPDFVAVGKYKAVAGVDNRDLAIIAVENCPLKTVTVSLAANKPKLGSTIYVVGNPLRARYVLTKGIVSRSEELLVDGQTYSLFSAPVSYGNSGGPCFNQWGELIGIVDAVMTAPARLSGGGAIPIRVGVPHLQLAIPLMDIKAFLKASGFHSLAK